MIGGCVAYPESMPPISMDYAVSILYDEYLATCDASWLDSIVLQPFTAPM